MADDRRGHEVSESFTVEYDAMVRALELAATRGVPLHPNPRVGCVILDADGAIAGEGYHHGAGTPHAEVEALEAAGERARGGTAIVTLEPCNHTGRTGPCSQALRAAGVRRVVHAQTDPNPVAGGGAEALRAAGLEVEGGLLEDEARALNRTWTFAHEQGRPFVTWKVATTLDGRSAAADGTSRWVTSAAARRDTHVLRALCDTMLVGTNTVAVDDPLLTVRDADDKPLPSQPLRVVMGERDLPADARILVEVPGAPATVQLRTHDPIEALTTLYRDHERQHVFFEGGPTLAAAFLHAGVIDEVIAYVAPRFLGGGRNAIGDLGIETMADALTFDLVDVTVVGEGAEADVRLLLEPQTRSASGQKESR